MQVLSKYISPVRLVLHADLVRISYLATDFQSVVALSIKVLSRFSFFLGFEENCKVHSGTE